MAYSRDSKSAKVRTQLTHPVIDGDGHWLEPIPIFLDYLRQVAGPKMTGAVEKFMKKASGEKLLRNPCDRSCSRSGCRGPARRKNGLCVTCVTSGM